MPEKDIKEKNKQLKEEIEHLRLQAEKERLLANLEAARIELQFVEERRHTSIIPMFLLGALVSLVTILSLTLLNHYF